MKRKLTMTRLFALILSCEIITFALGGCRSVGDAKSSTLSGVLDQEKITLTVAAPEHAKIEDYNTNATTLMIEEALDLNLEFVTFPAEEYEAKLNTMVMSGYGLPDIIFNPGSSYVDWAAEGELLALNEYYENPDLAKNIMEASIRTGKDISAYLSQADGVIYGLPAWGKSTQSEVWGKIWVYEPWLEAVGLRIEDIVTTDDFYEACKLIANSDPNGNDKADEVGMTGYNFGKSNEAWFECLMSPFVYAHDEEYRVVSDGQISFAYTTEEWREGLRYMKRFFDEGLITADTLTQSAEQWKAVLYAEEMIAFSFAWWAYSGTDYQRRADFSCIPALEGPAGQKNAQYTPSLPGVGAVISANCEYPEAAFQVCDFMCSETVSLTSRWGQRGQNWDYWAETDIDTKEECVTAYPGEREDIYMIVYDDTAFWSSTDVQNVSYLQKGPYVWDERAIKGMVTPNTISTTEEELQYIASLKTNAAVEECHLYSPKEVVDYMPLTAAESSEISDIKAALQTYVIEMTCAFLTGSKSIETDWDAYLTQLKAIGYEKVLEVYQVAYDRIHE